MVIRINTRQTINATIYTSSLFKETDPQKQLDFIRQHSFGVLVKSVNQVLQATHLPFELVEKEAGQYVLQTHLARANPQWRTLDTEREVLVIFQGPHAYISPSWYDHVNVPTMNYLAVHAYGLPRLVEDAEEVVQLLKKQVDQQEGRQAHPFRIEQLPEKFLRSEMRGLVALEVTITRLEASFKLSQNRDETNYRNILSELSKSENPQHLSLLEEMRQVYERKGYKQ